MCGFVVAFARYDPPGIRRVFGWAWHYLRRADSAGFTCAIRCLARELAATGVGLRLAPPPGSVLFTPVGMGQASHPIKVRPTCSAAT